MAGCFSKPGLDAKSISPLRVLAWATCLVPKQVSCGRPNAVAPTPITCKNSLLDDAFQWPIYAAFYVSLS